MIALGTEEHTSSAFLMQLHGRTGRKRKSISFTFVGLFWLHHSMETLNLHIYQIPDPLKWDHQPVLKARDPNGSCAAVLSIGHAPHPLSMYTSAAE